MRKMSLVIKHEFITSVTRPSFWLTTVVFPLLIVALSIVPQLLGNQAIKKKSLPDVQNMVTTQMQSLFSKPSGYVDPAHIISSLPSNLPPQWFIRYEDEAQAAADLRAQKIARYYVVAADYLRSGSVTLVTQHDDLLTRTNAQQMFTFVLNYNLLHDESRAVRLTTPLPKMRTETWGAQTGKEVTTTTYALTMGIMTLFLILISMSSGFMLNSVSEEKQSRVMEMLLLRVEPRRLMFGKLIGLGAVALLQLFIWLGSVALVSQSTLSSYLSALDLSPTLFAWVIVYFVLGYIVYATELGVLGTMIPSARESGGLTFLILLPLLIPMWLSSPLLEAPNGTLSLFLSMFPLSAPISMPTRMTLVQVPLWQSLLTAGGLAVTAYLLVLLSTRFFRSDTLLSQQSFSWQRLRNAWRNRG